MIIIKYITVLLFSMFLVPLTQTAAAQSVLNQIAESLNDITGLPTIEVNSAEGQATPSPDTTGGPSELSAPEGRQDLANPSGQLAFEQGMSTADQIDQIPNITRQNLDDTVGQYEDTLVKPSGQAGLIENNPNVRKIIPNTTETVGNVTMLANQDEATPSLSATYPSNASRPGVDYLTPVQPAEYMNYTSELNRANIGGNDTPSLATTLDNAFESTSQTLGDTVGNIVP